MVHVSDSNVARHFQLPLLVHGAICLSVHSISLQSTSEVYRMHFSFHEFCTAPVQWLLITQANSNHVDRNLCGICVYLFVCLFVCLSVCFSHDISKTKAARITRLHRNVPPWVLETHLFWGWKVKVQGHEAQKTISSHRSSDRMYYQRLLHMSTMLDFPRIWCCCHFFHEWSFEQRASGRNTLPAWVMSLLWVLSSSIHSLIHQLSDVIKPSQEKPRIILSCVLQQQSLLLVYNIQASHGHLPGCLEEHLKVPAFNGRCSRWI